MNKFHMNPVIMIAVVLGFGAVCAAGGAAIGYQQGYKTGDFDGRHDATRSSLTALTGNMTHGVSVKRDDGSIQTYVLKPVEAQSTKN